MISGLTGMRLRSLTVKDVATMARVSTATVARVVNGGRNVSSGASARVIAAISRLQYSPNTCAAGLRRTGGGAPRRCTARDVAELARVSVATVSRVLSGTGNVSCKPRARVLSAISRLQYCPNAYAVELGRANGGIPRKRMKLGNKPASAQHTELGAKIRGERGAAIDSLGGERVR